MIRLISGCVWFAAALALAGASCGGGAPSSARPAPLSHPALFYNDALFFSAVRAAEALPPAEDDVAGGIIPHDWRGGRYIAWLFRSLAGSDPPDTVILIGPNHDNEGYPGVLTSGLPWSTPFGAVQPDSHRIGALIDQRLVSIDDSVLATEHSVAGIMPAIAYYLPEARVLPLVIRGDAGPENAARLGEALAAQLDGDAVLVTPVDFSHDLVSEAAQRNNAVTLQALRAGDSATLFTLDNRYLDSPESIAALMASMASAGAGPFVLIADTNSAALQGDELGPTTSYLVGYYPAGDGLCARGSVGSRSADGATHPSEQRFVCIVWTWERSAARRGPGKEVRAAGTCDWATCESRGKRQASSRTSPPVHLHSL